MDGRACAAVAICCAAVVVGATAVSGGASKLSAEVLQPHGVGAIRFGKTKRKTVIELSRLFGTPWARGLNTACGFRYSEVEWADFVAEFRSGRFSGFRFIKGGYPLTTAGSPREASPSTTISPKLAFSAGVSLGSSVAELRAAYAGRLQRVGANMWRSADGLIFVDDAKRDPVPPTSHIVEIKTGTCGAF
jgi:hypothetical protein